MGLEVVTVVTTLISLGLCCHHLIREVVTTREVVTDQGNFGVLVPERPRLSPPEVGRVRSHLNASGAPLLMPLHLLPTDGALHLLNQARQFSDSATRGIIWCGFDTVPTAAI